MTPATQIYKLLQTQPLILPVIILMDMTPFTHKCVNNIRNPLMGTATSTLLLQLIQQII